MELQEFITETLTQIVKGVADAQKKLKETGCLINPKGKILGDRIYTQSNDECRTIQKVKMNVVLSVAENKETSSKIGIFKILEAGVGKENINQNTQMTTLEFDIPIALPAMEEKNE